MGIYEVIIPPKNQIEDFEIKAAMYRRVITNNISENNKLAELRDWLLPMLMNGQATVADQAHKLSFTTSLIKRLEIL